VSAWSATTTRLAKTFRFWQKTWRSSFYRRRPAEAARLVYARRRFAWHTVADRIEFLTSLGIDARAALSGLDAWWPRLQAVVAERSVAGVTKNDAFVLYAVVRSLRPDRVIETGVAEGVSSAFIGAALLDNGHGVLHSLDLAPEPAGGALRAADGSVYRWPEKGLAHLVPPEITAALGDRWQLHLGDVRQTLPALLGSLPEVDLFFHDDLHTPDHQRWEYELVWPRIRAGGVLMSDDATHAWADFVRRHAPHADPWANFRRMTALRKPGSASPFSARAGAARARAASGAPRDRPRGS
jgi:predicted O-methyltransferase YrrM